MTKHNPKNRREGNKAIEQAILDGIEQFNREQAKASLPQKEKTNQPKQEVKKRAEKTTPQTQSKERGKTPRKPKAKSAGTGTLLKGAEKEPQKKPAIRSASEGTPLKISELEPHAPVFSNGAENAHVEEKIADGVEKPTKKSRLRAPRAKSKPEKTEQNDASARVQELYRMEMAAKYQKRKKKQPVKILFFGGVGEIGKNMTAIEYNGNIIVIDAGVIFPTEEMPGIDLVFPDITYLVQNKEKIRGVFLTHGHEDHIGGVPYLMKEIGPQVPVYGTKLTLALTENKLREHKLTGVRLVTVSPNMKVKAGTFTVGFVNVNHSIAGALALTIETPYGVIFHSGDFKIDLTPVAGAPIDLDEIASLGKRGVLLYLGESTNIERPGFTMSEKVVGTTLEHIFSENTERRLIIATFASNVHRLQQIIDIAVKFRRRVALSGRSMLNVVETALKIGEMSIPEGVLIDVDQVKNYPDREIVIVSTGAQGEPMSALYRMASGEFNKITIGTNDTIIISANPIPGNERMIYRVINNLFKLGADVIYESLEKIHVSGHACQEEHKIMHTLLKPKFFIPVHGEYRHLKRHALLAEELGMPDYKILIPDIGMTAEITDDSLTQGESFPAGARLIDGEGFEALGASEVLKERILMSSEGIFVLSLAVMNRIVVSTRIESRGVVFTDEKNDMREIRELAERTIESAGKLFDTEEFAVQLKKTLRNYFFKKTRQSPMIIILMQEI